MRKEGGGRMNEWDKEGQPCELDRNGTTSTRPRRRRTWDRSLTSCSYGYVVCVERWLGRSMGHG